MYFFLGGMLGLFCGMSFLSIFELFFWMSKAIFSQIVDPKIKKKRRKNDLKVSTTKN